MFRSAKFSTVLGVALILGHASIATGDAGSDRKVATQLHRSLPDLVDPERRSPSHTLPNQDRKQRPTAVNHWVRPTSKMA